MKAKRILAALLAFGMVASLAACGGKTTTEESKPSGGSSTTSTETSKPAQEGFVEVETEGNDETETGIAAAVTGTTAEDILARDYSTHYDVSIASIQIDEAADYNTNEYTKWWTETFNVTWDITPLGWDVWAERLNTWINADDMPDMATWNFNAGDLYNYADQGLIKQMPENWRELYPNLSLSSTYTAYNAYYEQQLGGMYAFFRPVFANNFPAEKMTGHMSMMMRTDWAEEIGFDLSAELEADAVSIGRVYEYARALKEAKGANFYPIYNSPDRLMAGFVDFVSEASGVNQSPFYLSETDGQYHWGPAEAETGVKEALRAVKAAYDEGLIYPEFYTLINPDDAGHFYAAGDCAILNNEGMAVTQDTYTMEMKNNLGLDFWEVANQFVITDDEGVAHADYMANYWVCNIFSPNIDDAKLERILTIHDYSCTEEGQLLIRMGIPEVDWTRGENGELISLYTGEQSLAYVRAIHPIYGNMFILSDDFSFINPNFTQRARDKATNLYNVRSSVTKQPDEPDWIVSNHSSQALNLATMTYADEYSNIITKEGDFDANYDQWVADKMVMIQPVLDELNAKLNG